jgi:hypothetical protein
MSHAAPTFYMDFLCLDSDSAAAFTIALSAVLLTTLFKNLEAGEAPPGI